MSSAGRPACFAGGESRHHRGYRGLRLFTAESAAHALADAHDLVLTNTEHFGHEHLNLGRILRRRMDNHLALLARICDGGLRFEIELLLTAAGEGAAESVRRGGQL